MTYGYHRVGILAALVNGTSLVVIALMILWEAVDRLRNPEAVSGSLMIVVALAAIAINCVISLWLRAGTKDDLNVRSAYVHMIGDAISAVGVVLAGIVVTITGAHSADTIVSFLIAALILYSCWGVLNESVYVLLEGTPLGIDMESVHKSIASFPGVLNVHDLHVWTIGPGAIAGSCHILVADQSLQEGQRIINAVAAMLADRFKINHATIQIEVDDHPANELYCSMVTSEKAAHTHKP